MDHLVVLALLFFSAVRGTDKTNLANMATTIPDLGKRFSLGEMYDIKTDTQLGGTLFTLNALKDEQYVHTTAAASSNYKFAYSDSVKDKNEMFNMEGHIAFKYATLTGMELELEGSAKYLNSKARSNLAARSSVKFEVRTVKKSLNSFDDGLLSHRISLGAIPSQATHFVSSIIYGADCVAVFEQKASTEDEKMVFEGELQGKLKTLTGLEVEGGLSMNMNDDGTTTSKKVKVEVYGDVIPGDGADGGTGKIPTDPDAALAYLTSIHTHAIKNGEGVPMVVVMTPIKWLINEYEAFAEELDNDLVNQVMDLVQDLDVATQLLHDLSDTPNNGFLAWTWGVDKYKNRFIRYQREFKGRLSDALKQAEPMTSIQALLTEYDEADMRLDLVRKYVEEQYDAVASLTKLVVPIANSGGVPMARRFSDYMAHTLSTDFDAVIALIITGMNPSAQRETMNSVRRFLAFANSKRLLESSDHCLQAFIEDGNGGSERCVETYKMVVIHFDSFCSQFCPKAECVEPKPCADPEASALLDFSKDRVAWCANPCTRVIAHIKQGPAGSADSLLPPLPEVPTITNATLRLSADGVQEKDPNNQRVTISVGGKIDGVMYWQVRIIYYDYDEQLNRWRTVHSAFATRTSETVFIVPNLVAGRFYAFQVAAVNDVGEGAYSAVYPSRTGRQYAKPVVTITPRSKELGDLDSASAQVLGECALQDNGQLDNAAPNWMPWDVNVTVSTLGQGQELPAKLVFLENGENGDPVFQCAKFDRDANNKLVAYCTIPCNKGAATKTLATVVYDANGAFRIATGTFKHEDLSGAACKRYSPQKPIFCDVEEVEARRCIEIVDPDNVCAACNDATTNKTYLIGDNVCSANRCENTWCPTKVENKGCIDEGTCATNCDPESTESEDRKMCVFPCTLTKLVLYQLKPLQKVSPGSPYMLQCQIGKQSVWEGNGQSRSNLTYTCPRDNAQKEHDFNQMVAGGYEYPICETPCSKGTFQINRDKHLPDFITYPELLSGQPMTFDCTSGTHGVFSEGQITLMCPRDADGQKDRELVVLANTCMASCATHQCPAGYSAAASGWTSADTDSCCTAVLCPAGSIGINVPEGCGCLLGYFGGITASTSFPFYEGSCQANQCTCPNGVPVDDGLACPSNGALQCKSCNAGYHGWKCEASAFIDKGQGQCGSTETQSYLTSYCCHYNHEPNTKDACEAKCRSEPHCVAYSWKRSYTDCQVYEDQTGVSTMAGVRTFTTSIGHHDAQCYKKVKFDLVQDRVDCQPNNGGWLGESPTVETCAERCAASQESLGREAARFVWAKHGDKNCKCVARDCTTQTGAAQQTNMAVYEYL